jgi:hypothetical protein
MKLHWFRRQQREAELDAERRQQRFNLLAH